MGAAWEGLSICGLREGMGKGARETAGWWPFLARFDQDRIRSCWLQAQLTPPMPTCDLAVLSSFLQEFQCRLKRGGKKCETLGCPERGQLGFCSSQNILVPAAEASLSAWLPVCPAVPQLQEVSVLSLV